MNQCSKLDFKTFRVISSYSKAAYKIFFKDHLWMIAFNNEMIVNDYSSFKLPNQQISLGICHRTYNVGGEEDVHRTP